MSKQVPTLSPKLFIGLDIHKNSWRFHLTPDLVSGTSHTFPPGVEKIKNYVRSNYEGYEVSLAGGKSKVWSFWRPMVERSSLRLAYNGQ